MRLIKIYMVEPVFVDTHGFFALLSKDDVCHNRAVTLLKKLAKAKTLAVTSDWIIGETCSLLTFRKHSHLIASFLKLTTESKALQVLHIDPQRFEKTKTLLQKNLEHRFSFTDCTSFVLMKELKISAAITADKHFKIMGFNCLL